MTTSTAREIVLAASPAGNAVMHVFDAEGNPLESQAGQRSDLLEYCKERFPEITPKEITK
jgi:hypothetical protein